TMPRTDRPGSSQPAASTAALTAPAEVPQTIVYGFSRAGQPPSSRICRRASSTPTWYAARAPPPIRIRPVSPRFATTLHAPSAAGIRPELAGFQCLCILACRSAAIRVGRTAGSGARVDRHERHRPARSMEEAHAIPYLREILLFLALAGVLVPLLQRFRVSSVLGFLAVGILVGPFGLGRIAADVPILRWLVFPNLEAVAVLSEIGVMFLMFMIGLELSAERLWPMRRWAFAAGSAQVLASAATTGLVAAAFGNPLAAALVIGLALSFSSTAVVMQLLSSRRELGTPIGQ